MPSRLWHWLRSLPSHVQQGQGLAEYGLLVVLMAVACVAVLTVVGRSIDGLYSQFAAVFPR
jgi:Flp pilus assembly pilin Flp